MTEHDFTTQVRLNRGKLTKHSEDIVMIFRYGIPQLHEFTLTKKLMGIKNISFIATKPRRYQQKFCSWMADKHWKATKNELDLWFSTN